MVRDLVQRFGKFVSILLIVDDQGPNAPGPCAIQSEWNVLIDFVDSETTDAPYARAINNGLLWAANSPFSAIQAPDLATAYVIARATQESPCSSDGFPIFDGISQRVAPEENFSDESPLEQVIGASGQ